MSKRHDPNPIPGWFLLLMAGVVLAAFLLFLCWAKPASAGPDTRVFEALHEVGDLSEWDGTIASGGNTVANTGTVSNSLGKSMLCTASGTVGTAYGYTISPPNPQAMHFRGYINPGTYNGGTFSRSALRALNKAKAPSVSGFSVFLADLGTTSKVTVAIYDDDETIAPTNADTITQGAWHRVEIDMTSGDPDGSFRIRVDDQLLFGCDTLDSDGSMPDSIVVGFAPAASATGWVAWDDVVIDTMPCLDCRIEPVKAEYDFSSPFGGF